MSSFPRYRFQDFASRIRKAETLETLKNLDSSLDRLYNAGIFTPNQLMSLDLLIVDKKIELEG